MQPWYVREAEEKSGSICRAGIRQKALGAAVACGPRCTPPFVVGATYATHRHSQNCRS